MAALRSPGPIYSRREELGKTFGSKARFQLGISRPKQTIKINRECYKRRALGVHVHAKSASFDPSANRNHTFINKGDSRKIRVQTFQQLLVRKLCGGGDPLLMFENLNYHESRAIECAAPLGQKHLTKAGLTSQKRREQNVGIDDDARWIHSTPYLPKRCSFFFHQSSLISSDNLQASSAVSWLRRAAASTLSQFTNSFTCSADIPSVGKARSTRPFSAFTSIIYSRYCEGLSHASVKL